jgi:periplasmic copper chaperone A
MTMKRFAVTILTTAAFATSAWAQVSVKDAWVRATVAQQKATGAFMRISAPHDARLVEAHSSVADSVEMHEMSMQADVMKMRAVAGIDLPAGKPVDLKPGGFHLMLLELKQQLKEGDSVPITLVVEDKDKKRQTIQLTAPVRSLNAQQGVDKHKH